MTDANAQLTATLDPPFAAETPPAPGADDRRLTILGVEITDVTRPRAVALLQEMIQQYDGRTRSVFFVNAHTLNWAAADPQYLQVLNTADCIFGDGTGVRWAARLQHRPIADNVNGTDLMPELFRAAAGHGYRYFLLGSDQQTIRRAALYARQTFPGMAQAGYHHGYLDTAQQTARAIRQINQSGSHLLLVGMGNPLQERWIHAHRHELNVPVCIAVGGLFNYWSGDLRRSPRWLRWLGAEWVGVLLQHPYKARRYLLGNPLFLTRILREAWTRHPQRNVSRAAVH